LALNSNQSINFSIFQDIKPTNNEESAEHVLGSLARMTVLITHLIVEFAKSLPGFTRLLKEDQIILLKVSSNLFSRHDIVEKLTLNNTQG